MADLEKQGGMAAIALRFMILTACRSGKEVRLARWSEIDTKTATWTIPGPRMKMRVEHKVPLSDSALAILTELADLRGDDADGYVFPGQKPGAPLDEKGMRFVLQRMGQADITPHGFRSTLTDWCADTGRPDVLAEAALAHAKGKVQGAYQRSTVFDGRRRLMQQWADHCARPVMPESADVIALRA
jgi:integrase